MAWPLLRSWFEANVGFPLNRDHNPNTLILPVSATLTIFLTSSLASELHGALGAQHTIEQARNCTGNHALAWVGGSRV